MGGNGAGLLVPSSSKMLYDDDDGVENGDVSTAMTSSHWWGENDVLNTNNSGMIVVSVFPISVVRWLQLQ